MRHIRSATLALALVAGTAVVASAQATQPAPQRTEQHVRHGKRGAHPGRRLGRALFHGIALSDAEKAQLKTVRAKYEPELKQLRESAKPQMQALRKARQQGDSARLKELWAQTATTRAQGAVVLQRMRVDLRAALAPEHRAQFDQNVTRLEQRVAKRASRMRRQLDGRPSGKTGA